MKRTMSKERRKEANEIVLKVADELRGAGFEVNTVQNNEAILLCVLLKED